MTTDRIPVAHSVVYAVRGVPEVPDDYNAERTIAPHEISLTYRTTEDSQLGRVHAYVKGWWMQDGQRVPMDKPVGRHFWGRNFDGWPEWLAEEARLHDPGTAVEPPTDQTHDLSVQHADALWDAVAIPGPRTPTFPEQHARVCRAVAGIIDEVAAIVPPDAQADVLREAADAVEQTLIHGITPAASERDEIWDDAVRAVATELRRLADEAQPGTEAHKLEHTWAAELHDPVADEWVPGTRYNDRNRAVKHLAHARSIGPTWKDGTPVQRRLVRATTTYTVEDPS